MESEEPPPKKRKERSENWTEQEKLYLLELMKIYGKPILDKTEEKKDKELAWNEIYQGMKVQGCKREKLKIKDMWKRMKLLAKTNNHINKNTPIDMQVASLCPEVLIIDSAPTAYNSSQVKHDSAVSDESTDPNSSHVIHEEKILNNDSIHQDVIARNNNTSDSFLSSTEYSNIWYQEKIKQQIKHEDALFKLKYDHMQKMYDLELEQKKQKHRIEMDILFSLREKVKATNINLFDVINHLK